MFAPLKGQVRNANEKRRGRRPDVRFQQSVDAAGPTISVRCSARPR